MVRVRVRVRIMVRVRVRAMALTAGHGELRHASFSINLIELTQL